MKRPLIILATAAVLALGACSHSADRVPDYHTLVGKQNQKNMDMAVAKCNESSSSADRATNPWCGIVQKANRCMDPSYFGETPTTACPKK
jgi:hypothetical protein